jgi:hypothetical protein
VICIEEIRLGPSGKKENYGYRTCSHTDSLILTGDTIEVKKFTLSPYSAIDYGPQYVLFKANSLATIREKDLVPFTDLPADSAISEMIKLLKDNPTIILQLNGNCDSSEINPDQLSQQRAELVAEMLKKRGVPKERLVTKGLGNKKPLISNKDIEKASPSEKKKMLQFNRRVVASIASFDYKPEK